MKNPLRLLGIYRKADAALSILDEGKRDTTVYRSAGWWERLLVAGRALALSLPIPVPVQECLIMRSWRTTLAGIAAILSVVVKAVQSGTIDWGTDAPAVMAGIGLIVAKDAVVSGPGK